MRLLLTGGPWSLVRRISVLVLTVGLLSLLIQFLVLRLWTAPLIDDHAQALASQVRSIHTALRLSPPSTRTALARALSQGPVNLQPEPPGAFDDEHSPGLFDDGAFQGDPRPPPGATSASGASAAAPPGDRRPSTPFATRLAAVLGAVKLHDDRPGRLLFELPIDGERWWLTLRAPAPPQALLNTALLWLALLGMATLLAIVLGLRWIARPVRTLAAQITQQRGALRPLAADAQSSAEIQTLVRAFNELVHANAMAASLRQQLLAGVSHDLRTPLTRLRLRIETQCQPPLADALETDLLALQHIVDQFLAYVQGDTGLRLGLERPVTAQMAEVAADYADQGQAVEFAQLQAGIAEHPARLPDLALRRLLENLVNNAIAHGQPPVRLSLQAQADAWLLSVADRGTGMGVAEFAQARQPFVRLNGARAAVGHCGLGLAIADQIAQQLGGRLQVQPRTAITAFEVQLWWPRAAASQGETSGDARSG